MKIPEQLGAKGLLLFCAVLMIVSTIPLWVPPIPPIIDLPGHIGSYHLELHLRSTPALQRYYSFSWQLLGNLGGELWIAVFGKLLGVEPAAKLAVIVSVLLQAAGMLAIAREAHGRIPPTALLALPFIYSFPFFFGFVNYCLGMGLALLGFGAWLWMERTGHLRARWLAALLFAPLVWLTHAIAWALLALMCGGAELWRIWRAGGRDPMLYVVAALRLVPLVDPVGLMLLAPAGAPHEMAGFLSFGTLHITIASSLRDRWRAFDLISLAVPMLVVACALFRVGRLRIQPMLGLVSTLLLLAFLLMPYSINGSSWLQHRLLPYVEMLALLAVSTDGLSESAAHKVWLGSFAFMAVRLGGVTLSFLLYMQSWGAYLKAIDLMPRGARVLALAVTDCESPRWYAARTDHLAGLALERRDAFVNDQWTLNGIQLVGVHYPEAGRFATEPSQAVALDRCAILGLPQQNAVLASFPRAAFDYVWLLNTRAADRPHDTGLRAVWTSDRSALYRILR